MQNSILISKDEIKLGKEIPKERKEILYGIYKEYGKLDQFKLNEIIHSEGSPANMDKDPYKLSIIMMLNMPILDKAIARWYYEYMQ